MTLQKEILLPEEIDRLVATHFKGERTEIHRALSSAYTPERGGATPVALLSANVDYTTKTLRFQQQKTKGHSSCSWVIVPLSDALVRLIGQPKNDNDDERLFDVPNYDVCNRYLAKWVKKAGIRKKNYLALRASQLRGECPHKRSEHQDRFKPLGTHLGENDRKVSSCRGQPQAGRNQFPRRNKLCSRVAYANQKQSR